MSSITQERKTIAVNKEIAEKLINIAKKEGMTLISLINEVLETAIYCQEQDLGKCSDIISKYENLMIAKDINLIFIPLNLGNLVHKWAFETVGKKEILKEYFAFGKWIASYSKVRFPEKELEIIADVSKDIFWHGTEIKLNKLPNNQSPNEIELRIFGKNLNREYIECISKVYEGIFHEFKFKTIESEISEGNCYLKLEKAI
ncbi:MAG: hypothetical protein ACFFCM_00460 [Promethearchaeota archaeon]